jgi:Fanconi anemia group M protein
MDAKLNDSVKPREYQMAIAKSAAEKNTLVVLPTGMGKTLIGVLIGIERLKNYPDSRIMIMAPTRPLNAQHKKSFEKFTSIPEERIALITGNVPPEERMNLYKAATVIAATPQCIHNDLENGIIDLKDFSLIIFDEAHRCVKQYAYTYVAKKYMLQAEHPLILGLTASPGATHEKIKDTCDNLFIKAVEIRTEADADVEPYVKDIARDFVYVDFPEDFKKVKDLLGEKLKEDAYWLKEHHYLPVYKPSKKMLLAVQNRAAASYSRNRRSFSALWALLRSAEAIKIDHGIELLETQGIPFVYEYFEKMRSSTKRTEQRLLKDRRVMDALEILKNLHEQGAEHPKIGKLMEAVNGLVRMKPDVKIIIFANYRSTVDMIQRLVTDNGIKSEILIGQTVKDGKGLSQKEQIEVLRRFRMGEFNVLIGTSVSEEGIDVPAVDYAIFYEPVPSEIRNIQRRGRVGRQVAGKAIYLITKDTRDEAYYWSAFHKEKKMKKILTDIKGNKRLDAKKNLLDWTKK